MDAGSTQAKGNGRKPPPATGRWKPGQSGNPAGMKKKTPEVRELERLSKQQIAQRLEEMISPTLSRLLTLVEQKDDPATSLRAAALLLDRVVGPVPSAQYLQARVTNDTPGANAHIVTADEIAALARGYVARLDANERGGG